MATASKPKNKLKAGGKTSTSPDQGKSSHVDQEAPRDRALRLDIGIESKGRAQGCDMLNQVLANQSVLAVKTKNYHWNVTGIHFHDLHKFFEQQYDALAEAQDETAERIRMLGGKPLGNMRQFIDNATLQEETRDRLDAHTMLRSLLDDHEQVIKELREMINEFDEKLEDAGNADYLTQQLREHEKSAWMIRVMCE